MFSSFACSDLPILNHGVTDYQFFWPFDSYDTCLRAVVITQFSNFKRLVTRTI